MKFMIESDYVNDAETLYVDEKIVGRTSHDEHGWAGMESARDMFKKIAVAVGAELIERQNPTHDDDLEDD